MTIADAYGDLRRIDRPVVTTAEAAARLHVSVSNASHKLRAMERAGLVLRLRRGLWALESELDPFVVPPYLTAPLPAYVSFWSALARHGMITQLPRQVSVASLDRARRVATAIATYEIHRLAPELFSGYRGSDSGGYLATPEKAVFDSVYVRAAGVRGGGGARAYFPELSLPADFEEESLRQWTSQIASPRLRTLVSRGLREALRSSAREARSH